MKASFKIENCNKALLQSIIKQMFVVDPFVSLRIGREYTDTASYLPPKDVVKHMRVNNEKLFTNTYDLDKPTRISFVMGAKILLLLYQFGMDENTIDLEIFYNNQTEENEYYAYKVVMIGKTLKVTEFCADKQYDKINILPIPDDKMQSLLDTSNATVVFDIDKESMKSIKSLSTIDKEGKHFEFVLENGKMSIRERSDLDNPESTIYRKDICDISGNVEDNTFICAKDVFKVMNMSNNYVVSICEGTKVVYLYEEDGIRINTIAAI